jgi:hypothetical protein
MKNNITLLLSLLLLVACQEADIPLYSGGNNIQFVKNLTKDSTVIAFLLAPGKTAIDSPLIVKTTGVGYPREMPYKITIDHQLSSAIEGTHFSLPEKTAFKANAMRDTTLVTFYRTPDMKTNSFRLVLRVEENDSFRPGQVQYTYKVFVVHDKIAQPDWWDANVSTSYLGAYSNKKYQTFIDVTGVADLSSSTPGETRAYALQLKYWLERYKLENNMPFIEDNGDEMTVTANG